MTNFATTIDYREQQRRFIFGARFYNEAPSEAISWKFDHDVSLFLT